MPGTYYTLTFWRVRPGHEDEFLRIWKHDLAPVLHGESRDEAITVGQSMEDRQLFCTYAPWASLEDMQTYFARHHVIEVLDRLQGMCDEVQRQVFEVMANLH